LLLTLSKPNMCTTITITQPLNHAPPTPNRPALKLTPIPGPNPKLHLNPHPHPHPYPYTHQHPHPHSHVHTHPHPCTSVHTLLVRHGCGTVAGCLCTPSRASREEGAPTGCWAVHRCVLTLCTSSSSSSSSTCASKLYALYKFCVFVYVFTCVLVHVCTCVYVCVCVCVLVHCTCVCCIMAPPLLPGERIQLPAQRSLCSAFLCHTHTHTHTHA